MSRAREAVDGSVDVVDYYELLGVRRDASAAEIKSAYRTLAKVMHPDAGGTSGTFRLLRQAFETLTDDTARRGYDLGETRPAAPAPAAPRKRARRQPVFTDDREYVPPGPRVDPVQLPWWHLTTVEDRIRYAGADGHAPAVAALAGCLVLTAPLALPVKLSPMVLVVWLLLTAAAAAAVYRLARRYLHAGRAHQAFAAEFDGRTVFGSAEWDAEQRAQRLTADLLSDYLTRLPGARVFHGLAWPGSVFADIDHAVLCGRRLVLVESKLWLPGEYTADAGGALWRNGNPFRGGTSRLPEAVAAYRDLLPGVEVCGALLIYPSRDGEVVGAPARGAVDRRPVRPMNAEQFVADVGDWLAQQCNTVDRDAFRAVLSQVTGPR